MTVDTKSQTGSAAGTQAGNAPRVPATAASSAPDIVTVEIYDQTYHLRGHDADYIRALAALVDGKMRAVAEHGTTVDSLRVAVLAALNLADELARQIDQNQALSGRLSETGSSLRTRASNLNVLLDELLQDERRIS